MATHDQDSEDFELSVQAYIRLFHQIGERAAAEICCHQDAAIEGLAKNNKSFVKAYRRSLEKGETLLLDAAKGLVEYRRRAGPLNFQLEKADTFIFRIRIALEEMGELKVPSKPEK